jgi:hypothetical protein
MKPFPEEHELIGLFESEPVLADADVPWTYNCLRFTRTVGHSTVECAIDPGYEKLTFRWLQKDTEIVVLDLCWVSGITVECENGREALIAHFRERHGILPVRIQLTPTIHVSWGTTVDLM